MPRLTHASFFTGMGGFDLAAEWAGCKNIFQVENDQWLIDNVLKPNFKNVRRYRNIEDMDGKQWSGKIDIVSGGDPCQPHSIAGKHNGTADHRYLWPQMLRLIQEIKPRWVINENVTGTISNMVLDQKITDLETAGYEVAPPFIIPAVDLNTDHKRDRVFIIANAQSFGRKKLRSNKSRVINNIKKRRISDQDEKSNLRPATFEEFELRFHQPLILPNKNGLPSRLDTINIHKAIGNSIIPGLAQIFFEFILKIENMNRYAKI